MGKVSRPKEVYDQELAEQGKCRSYRVEYHQLPDDSLAPVYGEIIVDIPDPNKKPKKTDQWWKRVKK